MLRHFLVTGLRNINRNRFVSIVIILGFSLSISILLPVVFLVTQQSKYDRFYKNSDDIYRITTTLNGNFQFATSPLLTSSNLVDDYAHLFRSAHFVSPHPTQLKLRDESIALKGCFVDSSFFKTFTFDSPVLNFLRITNPHDIVVTHRIAQIAFGDLNPIGRNIELSEIGMCTVIGIVDEQRINTHLDFDVYLSSTLLQTMIEQGRLKDLFSSFSDYSSAYNYVVSNEQSLPAIINALTKMGVAAERQLSESVGSKVQVEFQLQPIRSIISERLLGDTDIVLRQPATSLLIIIGIILFVIAIINYFNLMVNKYLNRSKEIGIKKTMGATRSHLFIQFIVESVLISIFSFFIGYIIMFLVPLHEVRKILDTKFDLAVVLSSVVLSIVLGCVAGIIPSAILASTKVLDGLRSSSSSSVGRGWKLKRILLLLQFSVSIVVIISLYIFQRQTEFMRTSDYGFDIKNHGILDLQQRNFQLLDNAVAQIPEINSATFVSDKFGLMPATVEVRRESELNPIRFFQYSASEDFARTFNLKIVAGKDSLNQLNSKTNYALINEEGVRWLGFESYEQSIGAEIILQDSSRVTISGVLKNFHFDNFKRRVQPLLVRGLTDKYRFLVVSFVDERSFDNGMEKLKASWYKLFPDNPFVFHSYSEMFESRMSYKKDYVLLLTIASYGLTMTLLGLLGLTINRMNLRLKEICVNKVMGASNTAIVTLLGKDFLILILISVTIGLPVGFLLAEFMLMEFVYKIEMTFLTVLPPVLIVSGIALVEVGIYAFVVARINPVKYLRQE